MVKCVGVLAAQGGNEKEVNKSLLALMRKWGRALHHQDRRASVPLKLGCRCPWARQAITVTG